MRSYQIGLLKDEDECNREENEYEKILNLLNKRQNSTQVYTIVINETASQTVGIN